MRVEIALPPGKHLRTPPAPVDLRTPFGEFRWRVREEAGARVVIEESFAIPQQRIAPARYGEFADFARRVDEAEGQELLLAP